MENVWKYFKPDQETGQERSYNRNVEARFNYVIKRIELYKSGIDDDKDLEWNIKDALVGEIFFSKEAMKLMPLNFKNDETWGIIDEIQEHGSYRILGEDGSLCCVGLSIYDHRKGLVFEHVIPFSIYCKKLLELYDNSELDVKRFKWLMSQIHVCIVTKEENKRLNKKNLSCMPKNWQWGDNPFARYNACGIEVWKGLGSHNIQ